MISKSAQTSPIRVALVDDDDDIRAGFAHQINRSRDFHLAGSFSGAESALTGLPCCKPDVVLMDINLPGMNGMECVRRLKLQMPDVQFIMLTVYQDSNRLINSLKAGASGYLLKRTAPAKLLDAIREVCAGGSPMTPEMARRVVQHFQSPASSGQSLPPLSPRETDVLNQLSMGFTYKEIADHLQIGLGTLQGYISTVYDKLRVHSRTEAVLKFLNIPPS
jgi:DNA-binding NarL/FixJ family response regulator